MIVYGRNEYWYCFEVPDGLDQDEVERLVTNSLKAIKNTVIATFARSDAEVANLVNICCKNQGIKLHRIDQYEPYYIGTAYELGTMEE